MARGARGGASKIMRILSLRIAAVAAAFAAIAGSAPIARAAVIVAPGFDLLQTVPGTNILGADFVGVPLGSFDFGGSVGVQPVGPTDTIIQRLDPVDGAGGSPVIINVEMVALQLVTSSPTNIFGPLDTYYLTLDTTQQSLGQYRVHFSPDAQTFDLFFEHVYFDIRRGAIDAPVLISDDLSFEASGAPWDHLPLPGMILVDGANHFLDGSTSAQDFFARGQIAPAATESFNLILTTAAEIPAPATLALFGVGLALLGALRRRA